MDTALPSHLLSGVPERGAPGWLVYLALGGPGEPQHRGSKEGGQERPCTLWRNSESLMRREENGRMGRECAGTWLGP